MDTRALTYRILRRLRVQRFLNWHGSYGRPNVAVPLLGDVLGRALMLYAGSWKVQAFRRIASVFPFGQMLDVGANEGQSIFDLVQAGLGHTRVLAFEPNTACAFYLQRLVTANRWLGRVDILPVALADQECCLSLELESETSAGGSVIEDLRPGMSMIRRQIVPCFRLDHLVEARVVALEQPFLMKIDVEGSELEVIRGSAVTLARFRPLVLCEILWAHGQSRRSFMRERNESLLSLLGELGYGVHRLLLNEDQLSIRGLERITEPPDDVYGPQNAHLCDYLFVPEEMSPKLPGIRWG